MALRKICFAILVIFMLYPGNAAAFQPFDKTIQPYDTLYIDHTAGSAKKNRFRIQDVYVISHAVVGSESEAFDQPSDLFIAENDYVYVADTGNHRIVELDEKGNWIRAIGDEEGAGQLKSPEGVFVTSDGDIFVADTGNQRVVKFNQAGEFQQEFRKPDSNFLPPDYYFVPSKLVIDERGVLYIVSRGSYQGLVRLSENGEFTGFFGTNQTHGTLLDKLKRLIFTEEQMKKESASRPIEPYNVTIDSEGFLFTTTAGVGSYQVKKLSAGGINRFEGLRTARISNSFQTVDVAVDNQNFFYVLDRTPYTKRDQTGAITIYSPAGAQLITFGRIEVAPKQMGLLSYPVSIDINSNNELWVLDGDLNMIQVYERTAFGDALLTAAADFYRGDYDKSEANWNAVLSLNEVINLTYTGLGEIAHKEGRIKQSLDLFKMSYDAERYSEAFWMYRLEWLESYFGYVFFILIALWVLYRYVIKRLAPTLFNRLPQSIKLVLEELRLGRYIMFHPYDGFYMLKGRAISFITCIVFILLLIASNLAQLYWTGFIYNPVNLDKLNWGRELLIFFAPIATWIVANYLISTIKDGEGRFREVFYSSMYALFPYIFFTPLIILLSNILVLDESILVSSLKNIMWIWIIVLFIIKSQVIHNYDFMENIKHSMTTVFTIAIMWLFIIVIAGLSYNFFDFIYQLYREVTFIA